jgi:hypothetical protein
MPKKTYYHCAGISLNPTEYKELAEIRETLAKTTGFRLSWKQLALSAIRKQYGPK